MSIYEKLYDFQKRIVDKFADRESFGLFIDMGLGKTPLSLAFAERNTCDKVIVITINPKALETESDSGSWLYWAKQSSIKYTTFTKSSNPVFDNKEAELLLINYEALFSRAKDRKKRTVLKEIVSSFIAGCGGHNVAIIVDESHKMKNLQSQQTLAINAIKRALMFRAKNVYTYLLTGTPFTTGYVDLYSQLKMLGYPETKGYFVDQFCVKGNVPGLLGWQQPIVGYKNVNELFRVVHKYAITIKSEEVVDLPDKIFVDHSLPTSESFKLFTHEFDNERTISDFAKSIDKSAWSSSNWPVSKANKKINNPFYRDIDYDIAREKPIGRWFAETAGTFHLRARQLSIGFQGNESDFKWFDKRRLAQLEHFLSTNEDNYVIFYNYTPELYEIFSICERLDYNIDVYCGEIKSMTFYNRYCNEPEEVQILDKKNVIIANFASGSTGMNWQAYNRCIFFSVPLYSHYEQAVKRLHRLNQKSDVVYHCFYQDNWLDKAMRKALEDGVEYSDKLFKADLLRIQSLLDADNS